MCFGNILYIIPISMQLCASTGPVLGRCWQHRPSMGPVLATDGMFTGIIVTKRLINTNIVMKKYNSHDVGRVELFDNDIQSMFGI